MKSSLETCRSRRLFLQGAGLGGLAVTIGPAVLPLSSLLAPANAQVSGDADIAAFAESVELSLVDAYGLAAGKLTTPEVMETATRFASHHEEHAVAFAAAAGRAATGRVNPKLSEMLRPELESAADEAAVVEVLFGLENAAAATYLFALGSLESAEARELAAATLPIEAQHGVVLGLVAEGDTDELLPVYETPDQALEPDEYPVDE
jgi:hypothetical protein